MKLKRLQKELVELKEKQKVAGVSDEEFQCLEAEKQTLQDQLSALLEEREVQRVPFSISDHIDLRLMCRACRFSWSI